MERIKGITACFTGRRKERNTALADEKGFAAARFQRNATELATDVLTIIFNAEDADQDLEDSLNKTIGAYGWTENLAIAILNSLTSAIEKGTPMASTATKALGRSTSAAYEFVKDHPAICAVIALGVLAILAPWVVEALGFGMEGPIADTFAAWWQARYAGYVPKGSLFSFFQRLGMVWRR